MTCIIVLGALLIAIPLCICCYLGVGICAKCRKGIYTPLSTDITSLPTTTTTNTVITDTSMDYFAASAPSPPPAAPYLADEYPQQTCPATDYRQEKPPPYSLQPLEEHSPQQYAGYPPEGHPTGPYST